MRRIYTGGRADSWTAPRQIRDENHRSMIYGQLQPMQEPGLIERMFGRFFR